MAEPIIEAKGIRKVYGGVEPVEVLHGIDLTIRAGEFVAVVGQSGSGKSTLLNILGALDRPTEGTVALEGVPFQELESDDLANLRNCKIGFIFQYHYLLDEFTCLENALMPILIRKGVPDPEDVERVTELLRRVGLGHRLGNRPPALSGGEQQRTAVVRALANEPRLVLADEPTGNLDSISGKQVYDLMRSMNRELGIAFVMVTHDDRLAREADRVLRIQDGYLEEA
ncbi:MAG TPA: ABC transporter ATP-binding protein [Armatimonadota bacterium]|nr:ABC transporter ATP-binding protein [Armatimonadota bacterium]HOJ21676.1 ABC transporter ATP-binding protein [Armatimonadota bacterium]HOM83286.1 ABC transporter ATP-binding protein [Armatimonadota bacterium]HOQ28474.1 ABC transporter ATP-binding protein [Armatimonadota bacterium]HPO74217.1 ABC transporter ATP-binding protein [Armatimonadota bacterium]